MKILSIMSGSSLDGIDIGIIQMEQIKGEFTWKISDAKTISYPLSWKQKLTSATEISGSGLLELNVEYARYNADLVLSYMGDLEKDLMPEAISFHGHTLFHNIKHGYSYQLGCCATLAALTSMTVVGDFRSMDVALGGQGAPLMAIVDELLFPEYAINLNLGGICNLSTSSNNSYIAYDIAPCNQLLNTIAGFRGLEYDKDGGLASKGNIQNDFLAFLESDDYYSAAYPKSLDNNYINSNILSKIDLFGNKIEDLMYTACHFIATQIQKELQLLIKSGSLAKQNLKMLITGGGALNPILVNSIRTSCEIENIKAIVPERELIEYKELLLMGLLAQHRLQKKKNVFAKYTGAIKDSISACLYEG